MIQTFQRVTRHPVPICTGKNGVVIVAHKSIEAADAVRILYWLYICHLHFFVDRIVRLVPHPEDANLKILLKNKIKLNDLNG
jgi:hypothetical protein